MKHPAFKLPLRERVDYLIVVAAIAGVEGKLTGAHWEKLQDFCRDLNLGTDEVGQVVGAGTHPDAARIKEVIERLKLSNLRFTLLTDLLFMAYADNTFDSAKRKEVRTIANSLGVNDSQFTAIIKYVEGVIKAQEAAGVTSDDLKRLGGDLAASLAAAGVPIAAVAVTGTVFGLSAAGITSGLAALGMGLGMASGLGVAAALGVGGYFGVRWMYKKIVGA